MYRIFQYRLPMAGQPDDLNRWMAGQRVVAVKQYVVESEGVGHLVFVVESVGTAPPEKGRDSRIDYREKLSEEDFSIYCQLRELRKQLAEEAGVPVYAVFSNAQLAEMVEKRINSPDQMRQLEGVGAAKVEKYGVRILELLKDSRPDRKEES